MRAARAIAWEFRRHHRWGLVAVGAYVAVFCAIRAVAPGSSYPITLDPPNGMAGWVIAPVTATFFYLVGVFSYGLAGDLAARQSIYPARMFTLPVSSAALAGWPMLYGTAAAAGLWLAVALFARWPGGIDVPLPLVWPALLMAVYLAWTQALMWMPYGLRGVRVVVAVLWLVAIDAVVLIALHYQASERLMIALLAPHIPLAYAVACYAVARARRGDVPDWTVASGFSPTSAASGFTRTVGPRFSRTGPFQSPAGAQTWFEWRRHGRTLPALVALVVPCELLLLFIPGNGTAPVVFVTLVVVLITPPFLAVCAAPELSASTPFVSRRPLASAAIVAAKLRMTIWSTLAAWLVVVVAIPAALVVSGRLPVVIDRARAGIEITGTLRGVAAVLLVFAALVASTWKHLVQSLCIGLSGRDWVIKSSVLLALAVLVAAGPIAEWIIRTREVQTAIWNAFPWIVVSLVGAKILAAAWVAIRLYGAGLLSDRLLVAGAACWLLAVVALYAVLVWFAASPLVPRYLLGAIAILQVPLARVSAAPLALAWNRHR